MSKSSLAGVLLLATAACSSPKREPTPPPVAAPVDVQRLKDVTVALVDVPDALEALFSGEGPQAFCTGVWVSSSSILTANHCTHKAPIGTRFKISVESDVIEKATRKEYAYIETRDAAIYDRDAKHDLALLRIEPTQAPKHAVARVSTAPLHVGAPSFGMGQAKGLWWSFAVGNISAERELDTSFVKCMLVQTTTPTSPGNSGGGLFDERGDLIGIAHASMLSAQNLNFYIHPRYITAFLAKQGGDL